MYTRAYIVQKHVATLPAKTKMTTSDNGTKFSAEEEEVIKRGN